MSYLDRLKSYQEKRVESVGDLRHDLRQALGIFLAEVDRDGRPWTGFFDNLTEKERTELKQIEARINAMLLADDQIGAAQVFIDYKRFVMAAKQRQVTQQGRSTETGTTSPPFCRFCQFLPRHGF